MAGCSQGSSVRIYQQNLLYLGGTNALSIEGKGTAKEDATITANDTIAQDERLMAGSHIMV